jgi:hypothetical protein
MPDDQLPSLLASLIATHEQGSAIAKVAFSPPFTFKSLKLPEPGPRRTSLPQFPEPPASLSHEQVWAGWTRGGTAWLNGLIPRDLEAVATAFRSPSWISDIDTKMPLFRAVWPKIRGKQRMELFTTVWFSLAPPIPNIETAFDNNELPPRWWEEMADSIANGTHIEWLGKQLLEFTRPDPADEHLQSNPANEHLRLNLTDLELTDAVVLGPWLPTVVENIALHTFDNAKRLIFLADKGTSRGPNAPVHRAAHIAICKLVKFGEDNPSKRPEVAELLEKRLGTVFGPTPGKGWNTEANGDLPKLLEPHRQVRSWLMGQVLDIIFVHLAPPGGDFSHQLEPRRNFWRDERFISRMQKVYILAGREFNTALLSPDILDLLKRFPNAISRRFLKGTPNQAIVWMHWLAPNGTWWTLIEGNQNCKIRIRRGVFNPPDQDDATQLLPPVKYLEAIVHGELSDDDAGFWIIHHGNGWTDHTLNFMKANGIVL